MKRTVISIFLIALPCSLEGMQAAACSPESRSNKVKYRDFSPEQLKAVREFIIHMDPVREPDIALCEELGHFEKSGSVQALLNAKMGEETLLIALSRSGSLAGIKCMLMLGASKDATSIKDSRTPLHFAAERGLIEIVSILLSMGAKKDTADDIGRTALHLAAKHGHIDIVTMLLRAGANKDVTDFQGNTPLHTAVFYCQTKIINTLLQAGANANTTNEHGNTPLHNAAAFCSAEVVNMLLLAGANKDAINQYNQKPLCLAAVFRNSQTLQILKQLEPFIVGIYYSL